MLAALFIVLLSGHAAVIDGDTIRVGDTKVRIHGIDAPEKAQECPSRSGGCLPCGKDAAAFLSQMLATEAVSCEPVDTDRYGRTVANCSVGGRDVGLQMIRAGWAVPYVQYLSGDQLRTYSEAFDDAKAHSRGIHAGRYVEPRLWRRGDRLYCR